MLWYWWCRVTEAYLHGKPSCQGVFKASPEDFQVTEILELPVTEPSEQAGEHQWLWVEKKGANTAFVASQIAEFAGVKERDVSYSGLKDRHALTYQWFSVQLPGQALLDWARLEHPEFKVLTAALQPRKLKTGTHKGNHFVLRIRQIDQPEVFAQRWQAIVEKGVPNYFGAQRFGHNGQNIEQAKRWFKGELKRRPSRHQSGLYLSAARSFLFNQVVHERLSANRLQPEVGDAMMLQGSQSFFVVDSIDDALKARFASGDIQLTAPLPGSGRQLTQANIAELEAGVYVRYPDLYQGLRKQRIDEGRRALLLQLQEPQMRWLTDDCAELEFTLGRGAFATSVLRELIDDVPHEK
ncbi:tRNA pseudouridine(13) synthase TruD [Pseudidiomarina donghaiensis]|nr:tRNA pseudouridine(13) synthase TruD [Pseudidiomarina donghaiensis]SFV21875.1 tRNA pseudouridine13 synthase [Pseudidiomarina donghaiensis]